MPLFLTVIVLVIFVAKVIYFAAHVAAFPPLSCASADCAHSTVHLRQIILTYKTIGYSEEEGYAHGDNCYEVEDAQCQDEDQNRYTELLDPVLRNHQLVVDGLLEDPFQNIAYAASQRLFRIAAASGIRSVLT